MHQHSWSIVMLSGVLAAFAITSVVLRLSARMLTKQGIQTGDVLTLTGLVLAMIICTLSIMGATSIGIGSPPVMDTEGPNAGFPSVSFLVTYGQIFFGMQILHTCAITAIKASLLLLYRDIFHSSAPFKIAANVISAYIGVWFVAILFATIFQCTPVDANWSGAPVSDQCISNPRALWVTGAITNVVSDIAIILLPIKLISKQQISNSHKLPIVFYALAGVLVIVAGIGRAVSYFMAEPGSPSWSYETYLWFIWTPMEALIGVIGICLPTMHPLFSRLRDTPIGASISNFTSRMVHRNPNTKNVYVGDDGASEIKRFSDDRIALKNTYDVEAPEPVDQQKFYPNGFAYITDFWSRKK